jgi:hypothetical protein
MQTAIERALEDNLGVAGDHYCLTEDYRIRGAHLFRFDLVMVDPETRRWRRFWFTVGDAAAQAGVLRVMLIEEET